MALEKNKIDKSVPIPLYFQLRELLLAEIKKGNFKSDELIPTENELCEIFELSRTTVRQAIAELVQEGYLYRMKSKGTFVARPKINQNFLTKIESFSSSMERQGFTASTQVLEMEVLPANVDVAKHLNIQEDDKVIFLHRKRSANGEPLVTIKTYLPYERCGFLLEEDLTKESLYSVLGRDENTKIVRIERRVEAIEATAKDLEYLGVRKGKPIQYFSSVGCNVFGEPIEYSLARYRADRSVFEITVAPE
ncbi:MAG: GntR family transcriptional regulator [Lachnospiraceae bacterium]